MLKGVRDQLVGDDPELLGRRSVEGCGLGLEPGRSGDAIVTRRKGVASLLVSAKGAAAHAGVDHAAGRNAIWSLSRFVDRAQALTDYAKGVTLNVGAFQGGTTRNTVPDAARAEVDLRYVTTEDGATIYAALEEAAAASTVEGTQLEVSKIAWRPPCSSS